MKRSLIVVLLAVLVAVPMAVAYPPATLTWTADSVTIGNLDPCKQVRIRIEERNASNTGWENLTTHTPTTACPDPPPTAAFSIAPDPAVRTQPTTFISTGSCPVAPCAYGWFHGTSTTEQFASGETGSFTYVGPTGTRTVTLRVTDALGRMDAETRSFGLVEPPAPTPTPTPTPEPTPVPTPTGYPDASNTGVPPGTVLEVVNGDLTASLDGQVVDAKDVRGCVLVEGSGVTIKNSKVECVVTASTRAENPLNPRLTVQDTEIACTDRWFTGLLWRNVTALGLNVHGCENGFHDDSHFTIRDSYVHDLKQCATPDCPEPGSPHTDGLQSPDGSNTIIEHNTIYGHTTGATKADQCGGSCNGTSAININNSAGGPTTRNVLIRDNLLAGGANTLYCPIPPTENFRVENNRFSTVYASTVGEFSPSLDCGGELRSGNVYHETGEPIVLP